jgi:hypothetical protein
VIDEGGSDITVVMSVMNTLTGMEIVAADLTNGAVTDYRIKLDTFVHLKDEDRILITTPPNIGFGPNGISCSGVTPDAIGVIEAACEVIDENIFSVSVSEISQLNGIFELIVSGMKNPPNFRRSGLFSDIAMQTFDYYPV